MPGGLVITAAVEGIVDEAVVRRLVQHVGAIPGAIYGRNGKQSLRRKIHGYNNAAQHSPWVILVDLDQEAECAPPLRAAWLARPAPWLCFRIAVRKVEAWLLADRRGIASFLRVALRKVPVDPESLTDPKQTMVNLAGQSRNREIREDMVPRPGSGRSIGPAYSSRLIEFATKHWCPEKAAAHCESLRRAIACLERLKKSFGGRHA
ncbi:MAG: hypothetical protein KatS3mg131_0259 [Candidatus Tectimicrobiota bacterium]|nr:MAG: hypothetical protein KatS3mg131_0259 [Candidatus Tectomicrobia bacterium]